MKKRIFCISLAIVLTFSLGINVFAAAKRTNQDCTAYLDTGNRMANGEWPKIGYVAVHPSKKGGTKPIIPFGTILYIDSIRSQDGTADSIWYSPEDEVNMLCVGDMGDVNYNRGLSTHWIDLYYGDYSSQARDWGKGKISYHYN